MIENFINVIITSVFTFIVSCPVLYYFIPATTDNNILSAVASIFMIFLIVSFWVSVFNFIKKYI